MNKIIVEPWRASASMRLCAEPKNMEGGKWIQIEVDTNRIQETGDPTQHHTYVYNYPLCGIMTRTPDVCRLSYPSAAAPFNYVGQGRSVTLGLTPTMRHHAVYNN